MKKWTKELILFNASQYPSKGEWFNCSPSSYNAARRLGIMDKASAHMARPVVHNKKWTKETVIEECKKYKTKNEWQVESGGSWNAAYRNDWVQEACKHMKSHRGSGDAELQILNLVRKYYPDAKTKRFSNESNKFSFKRMEIDVFIPILNKGIEFDGTYWHMPNVMRKNRPKWKTEEIQNYSFTKDNFFKDKGIELLHITENTWKSSKNECIQAILVFIGVKKDETQR